MTFEGTVKNGVVIFEGELRPVDGARVRVTELSRPEPTEDDYKRLRDDLLALAGASDLPPDAALNVDHYLYGLPKR